MTANPEQCDDRTSVNRRTVLGTIGGAAVLGAFAADAEGQEQSSDAAPYAVVQDGQCVPVVPLTGDQPVEDLYDYRVPTWQTGVGATSSETGPYYQSNGTTDLQSEDTTITFLYDGPNGLSLVVVHDTAGNDGGSVSWTIDGVPDGANWAVQDDRYFAENGDVAGSNYDNWDVSGSTHTIDWTWGDAGTDGGALRGLGEGFSLTVDPAFNAAAALWGQEYAEDPITDWQILSFPDGGGSPTRTSLALDQQVTIRAGGCGEGGTEESEQIDPAIDVKPGSDPAPINPRSNGVTPVAVLTSDALDPDDVNVDSLRFGSASSNVAQNGASPAHSGHVEDVDGDGDADLVVHFSTADASFGDGDSEAKLVGKTDDEQSFSATDSVRIVGNGGNDGDGQDDNRETEEQEEAEEEREEEQEREEEHEEEEREDDDDDENPGNGRGNGEGRGNGNGEGNGRGNGNGNGRGNGNGGGNGNGRGNGRGG